MQKRRGSCRNVLQIRYAVSPGEFSSIASRLTQKHLSDWLRGLTWSVFLDRIVVNAEMSFRLVTWSNQGSFRRSCYRSSSRNSARACYRSVLWLQQQQKQRPGAPCGSYSNRNSVLERYMERAVAPAAPETASGSVTWSALWLQQQQKQRLGASQERHVAPTVAETASGSITGASCGSCSSRKNVRQRHRNALWLPCGAFWLLFSIIFLNVEKP